MSGALRVLQVTSCLSPRYGGPAALVRELSAWLASAGHEVVLVSTDADYPTGRLSEEERAAQQDAPHEVRHFPVRGAPLLYSGAMHAYLRAQLQGFDIVHIHGLYRAPQSLAAHYARGAGVPYVLRPHGSLDPFLYNRRRNRLRKRAFEAAVESRNWAGAAAMHYTSETERDQARDLGIETRGVVIPHGITPPAGPVPRGRFRASLGVGEEDPLVLYLGRLHEKKGIDILLNAFARVAGRWPGATLAVVGPDGEGMWPGLAGLAAELGITGRVRRLDFLDGPAKQEALADATVLVLPSRGENYARAVVEAAAVGTPVIVSHEVNIWRELVDSGAAAACAPEPDVLAETLAELLADPARRRAMAAAGPVLIRERYGWERVGGDLVMLYQELLRDRLGDGGAGR